MNKRQVRHDEPCPCGKGKAFKECCFLEGFNWYCDENGDFFTEDGAPRREFAGWATAYPRNFVEYRGQRWAALEEHVFNSLRSLVRCVLTGVEYSTLNAPLGARELDAELHALVWNPVVLHFGTTAVRCERDYVPALSGDDVLTCVPHTQEESQQTYYSAAGSNLWRDCIDNEVTHVAVYGQAEKPLATALSCRETTVVIAAYDAYAEDAFTDLDLDNLVVARQSNFDKFMSPWIDEIWSSDSGSTTPS